MNIKKNSRRINIFRVSTFLIIAVLLFSCEGFQEEIVAVNIPVENVSTVIVINAEIEKDSLVWVQISYSEDVDAPVGTPIRYEDNAIITLETATGNSEILTYAGDGRYAGGSITGAVGESYTLTINIEGNIYTSSSTMLAAPGYQGAWVTNGTAAGKGGSVSFFYSEEWIVNDPSNTRNRYLFEWFTNGNHNIDRDWAIDDNRVVNINQGLRLINPTIDPGANEYIVFRAAEIDKITYDYYNMYEKIVRGIVGADSQTPFNPVSNLGEGTMGNFRAVDFSSIVILTPPIISANGSNQQNVINFPINDFFTKYNLYWSNAPGVTVGSNAINDLNYTTIGGKSASFAHENLSPGATYYYRIQVEDSEGNVSILSPEVSATPN